MLDIDMSAAFNSVDARIKIPKLQQLGLVEIATKLIKSYMTGVDNVVTKLGTYMCQNLCHCPLLGKKCSSKG